MNARALVSVGDIVNAEAEDYYRGGQVGVQHGDGDLHIRVTHVPMDAATWAGDWVTVRGVEMPPGQPEQPEACFVVHARALPGFDPAPLS
ncbi:hypothetical protein [Micromonospora sp. NPDC004704]